MGRVIAIALLLIAGLAHANEEPDCDPSSGLALDASCLDRKPAGDNAMLPSDRRLAEEPPDPSRMQMLELKGLQCRGGRFGMRMPTTVAGYRALGNLLGERSGAESDTYNWHRFEYSGLSVSAVFTLKKPHNGFAVGAAISDPRWNHLAGIKVGASLGELLALSATSGKRVTSPVSFCGHLEGAPDCAKIHFVKGVITKVEYEC